MAEDKAGLYSQELKSNSDLVQMGTITNDDRNSFADGQMDKQARRGMDIIYQV